MELSREDILQKMESFVESARQVKALKDFLLTFNFVSSQEEWLKEELARHDQAVEEVGRIYDEEMLPIIQELSQYLSENKETFDKIVRYEERLEAGEEHFECENCGFAGLYDDFVEQDGVYLCPECQNEIPDCHAPVVVELFACQCGFEGAAEEFLEEDGKYYCPQCQAEVDLTPYAEKEHFTCECGFEGIISEFEEKDGVYTCPQCHVEVDVTPGEKAPEFSCECGFAGTVDELTQEDGVYTCPQCKAEVKIEPVEE